ncbi:hypothetical protein AaE_008950 [Aphanomyces astaci]|uniref:Uncharacterized protein n=1 Tax=Aphanomyces astaci TaxID=112090 RepID=A0A6A4ZYJ8_APHAT|nr:hypothetical protein AaE_008950 [Aphanomyces astaci]
MTIAMGDALASVTTLERKIHPVEAFPSTLQLPDPISLLSQELKVAATVTRATSSLAETDIYSWGYGVEGSLGHNNTANCEFPKPITAFRRMSIQQCSAGRHLSLFVNDEGQVFQCGQSSDRTTASQWTPQRIERLPRIQTTATGAKACYSISAPDKISSHHVGQKQNSNPASNDRNGTGGGALFSWGSGAFGQLGHGSEVDYKVPQVVVALIHVRITLVRAGFHFAAAISSHGHLFTWGYGRHGQLGHSTSLPSAGNEVEASDMWSYEWQIQRKTTLGSTHSLAISGSRVYSWGQNLWGCLGIGGPLDRDVLIPTPVLFFQHMQPSRVSAGSDHSLFLCLVGVKTYVYACGSNRFGQLGINSTISHSDNPQCVQEFEYSSLSRRVHNRLFFGDVHLLFMFICDASIVDKTMNSTEITGQVFTWGDGSYSKTGLGSDRRLTCVPWLVEAISSRFALQVVVGYAHVMVLFRRGTEFALVLDDHSAMNRFRQFPIQRMVPFLDPNESHAATRSSGSTSSKDMIVAAMAGRCVCEHAGRSDLAPFGLFYRCVECNLQPICRWCSRNCHVHRSHLSSHVMQWVVLSTPTSHQCVCTSSPGALTSTTEEADLEL